jgi:hypothetical protein
MAASISSTVTDFFRFSLKQPVEFLNRAGCRDHRELSFLEFNEIYARSRKKSQGITNFSSELLLALESQFVAHEILELDLRVKAFPKARPQGLKPQSF